MIVSRAVKDSVKLDTESLLNHLFKRTSGDRALDIYLPQIVSEQLVTALQNRTLTQLYDQLTKRLVEDPKLAMFSPWQITGAMRQSLDDWLIEVESAISDWQHSDSNTENGDNIPFLFKYGVWRPIINLGDLARLRTFLIEHLGVSMSGRRQRPEYVRMLGPKK
jgi:hypothetical protein